MEGWIGERIAEDATQIRIGKYKTFLWGEDKGTLVGSRAMQEAIWCS